MPVEPKCTCSCDVVCICVAYARKDRARDSKDRLRASGFAAPSVYPDYALPYFPDKSAETVQSVTEDIRGKVVVITGAGAGIGLGMSQAFHAAGAQVTLGGLRQDTVERAAADLEGGRPSTM